MDVLTINALLIIGKVGFQHFWYLFICSFAMEKFLL